MDKSIKDFAKEAKNRLKSSFWQDYKNKVNTELSTTEDDDLKKSKVKDYYKSKIVLTVRGTKQEDEDFYIKVRSILSTYGEVSDIIGRLTDKEYFSTLTYEQKQKYTLELSNKYLMAKERYLKEKEFEKKSN